MRDFEQPPFAIEVAEQSGRTVLTLKGELDLATVGELEDALNSRLGDGKQVVVDLRSLEFMDSSGVRALVSGHKAAQDGAAGLTIVRAPRGTEVDRVIEVSGIATALGMVDQPPQE
jgi:anti-sigma B factor antagonist